MRQRIVVDTNVYVSRFLRPDSVPGRAVAKVWTEATPLLSVESWNELRVVLKRPKFQPYIQPHTVGEFLRQLWAISDVIEIPTPIRACRDPRDDKFLEVAIHGRADAIVTGDGDLLALHPFDGIAILTPAAFLGL